MLLFVVTPFLNNSEKIGVSTLLEIILIYCFYVMLHLATRILSISYQSAIID
jgi:hypothetical protein